MHRGRSARPFRAPEVQLHSGNPGQHSSCGCTVHLGSCLSKCTWAVAYTHLQTKAERRIRYRSCHVLNHVVVLFLQTGSVHSRSSAAESALQCARACTRCSGERLGHNGVLMGLCQLRPAAWCTATVTCSSWAPTVLAAAVAVLAGKPSLFSIHPCCDQLQSCSRLTDHHVQ